MASLGEQLMQELDQINGSPSHLIAAGIAFHRLMPERADRFESLLRQPAVDGAETFIRLVAESLDNLLAFVEGSKSDSELIGFVDDARRKLGS